MCSAAQKADVGPMAAIAGAISHYVGQDLLRFSPEVVVENGGDIYIKSQQDRVVGIYRRRFSIESKNWAIKIPQLKVLL
jgi:ApbE superfamily uncharacterized protein (UPF0280 family)